MKEPTDDAPLKVTVTDPATGKVLNEYTLENDFAVICAGNKYIGHAQRMGKTVMLSIKTREPANDR